MHVAISGKPKIQDPVVTRICVIDWLIDYDTE